MFSTSYFIFQMNLTLKIINKQQSIKVHWISNNEVFQRKTSKLKLNILRQ